MIGGTATLIVVGAGMWMFPALRRMDRFIMAGDKH
jgi:hypothetical protein